MGPGACVVNHDHGIECSYPRHECDIFQAESGAWFVRCYGCSWWVRKLTKSQARGAADLHEHQGVLVFA